MRFFPLCALILFLVDLSVHAADPDIILHNGKIVSVDAKFSIHSALAVEGGKILAVGSDADVLKLRGKETQVIDLKGKMVLPGLIDSHVHPSDAAMTEWDHPLPDFETIQDVLDYVKARTKIVPEGKWITLRQIFIAQLKEQRYPTRQELDEAAPKHPVLYATGPDASLNSLALKLSNIDKDFKVSGGYAEKDPKTSEPTGILRNCTSSVKVETVGREATDADRDKRLLELFADYNSVGLTGIIDRDSDSGAVNRYKKALDNDKLTLRIAVSYGVGTKGAIEKIEKDVKSVAEHPLCKGSPMLRIIGIKTYLDGGMLTGSAYMREPWGVSKIYSITDPKYKGLLFISKDRLTKIVEATVDNKLQFTAHSVGDGAVHTLLDVYEDLDKAKKPIRETRPCLTHSNFMSKEAVEKAAKLGVVVDVQPAWLYLDTRTLMAQFGDKRLRYFQPLKSLFESGVIVGGGSDHMQKIGSLRAVNPYNPWLGMWVTITRRAKGFEGQLHPEEALTREQAIRFYTINNAHLMFLEDKTGSLERGKLADFIVIDRDILTCKVDEIKDTQCLQTYVNGKRVYEKK